jgi:quercetin dioxygenase-like cupin family protein
VLPTTTGQHKADAGARDNRPAHCSARAHLLKGQRSQQHHTTKEHMQMQRSLAALVLGTLSALSFAADSEPALRTYADHDWSKAIVNNGIKRLPLYGDRNQPAVFVERLIYPAGFVGMPHTHPIDLHVVVISGTAHIGIGSTLDKAAATAVNAGGSSFIPANVPHYEWYEEDTEAHLFAVGPMSTTMLP